jgi:hypothetical protein
MEGGLVEVPIDLLGCRLPASLQTSVCGQCGQVCGLRTDFCGHTADTADKIADSVRTADTIFLWLEGTWYLKDTVLTYVIFLSHA